MAKFKLHINVSDLQQYDADELCQLQNELHDDHINDTLVSSNSIEISNQIYIVFQFQIFEPEVTEQDLLAALHVDAFYPSEFLLDVPVWFKATLTTMFIVNMIWSCAHNLRTLLSITFNKLSIDRGVVHS